MTEPHIHGPPGGSNHQPLPFFHRPKQKGGQLKKSRDDPLYSQKSPFFFGPPLNRATREKPGFWVKPGKTPGVMRYTPNSTHQAKDKPTLEGLTHRTGLTHRIEGLHSHHVTHVPNAAHKQGKSPMEHALTRSLCPLPDHRTPLKPRSIPTRKEARTPDTFPLSRGGRGHALPVAQYSRKFLRIKVFKTTWTSKIRSWPSSWVNFSSSDQSGSRTLFSTTFKKKSKSEKKQKNEFDQSLQLTMQNL